jgi:hypothetical protein
VRVRVWSDDKVDWCPQGVRGDVLTLHAVDIETEDYKHHNHYGLVSVASPVRSCNNLATGFGLNLYRSIDRVVRAFDMKWKYTIFEGEEVRVIDYYVVRIDIGNVSIDSKIGKRLFQAFKVAMLNLAEFKQYPAYSKYMIKWLETRWKAKDPALKFLNVAGGTIFDLGEVYDQFVMEVSDSLMQNEEGESQQMLDESQQLLDDLPISIKSGPLLRSTFGTKATHMPISGNSAAKEVVKLWKTAEKLETKANSLHIVSHSGRHTATCRARIMIIQTEVPPGLIDELIDGHMKWEAQDGRMRKRYTGHLDLKYRLCVTLWM